MTSTGMVNPAESNVNKPMFRTCLLPASKEESGQGGASCNDRLHSSHIKSLAPTIFASYSTRIVSLFRRRTSDTPSGHCPSTKAAGSPEQIRSRLQPWLETISHLNSVVRWRCLTTSSAVASLVLISSSTRARTRLV